MNNGMATVEYMARHLERYVRARMLGDADEAMVAHEALVTLGRDDAERAEISAELAVIDEGTRCIRAGDRMGFRKALDQLPRCDSNDPLALAGKAAGEMIGNRIRREYVQRGVA